MVSKEEIQKIIDSDNSLVSLNLKISDLSDVVKAKLIIENSCVFPDFNYELGKYPKSYVKGIIQNMLVDTRELVIDMLDKLKGKG